MGDDPLWERICKVLGPYIRSVCNLSWRFSQAVQPDENMLTNRASHPCSDTNVVVHALHSRLYLLLLLSSDQVRQLCKTVA